MAKKPPRWSTITSREYKMMLHAELFLGGEQHRADAVAHCWRTLSGLLLAARIKTDGMLNLAEPKKQRYIRFFDTAGHKLRRDFGLVYRLRRRQDKVAKWRATVKSRTGDRLAAARYRLRPKGVSAKKLNFEEDIKAPSGSGRPLFLALYSQTAKAKTDKSGAPSTLGDCLAPFDGSSKLNAMDMSAPVMLVNDFEAREHVFTGADIILAPKVRAESALILWTATDGDPDRPVVAELSFRYDAAGDGKGAKVAARAWAAFTAMYGARHWVDPNGKTKTAFVYDHNPSWA